MVEMNREPSLSRLERDSEQTRAQLAHTIDELRGRVTPAALKQDVKDYVRQTRQGLMDKVEQRVRDNPLQAVAVAAGLAYPAWRIVRSIPAPLLLIGAGLALARPAGRAQYGNGHAASRDPGVLDRLRDTVETATETVMEKAQQATEVVKEKTNRAAEAVQQAVSSTGAQISGTAERLQSAVSSGLDSARGGLADAAGATDQMVRNTSESATEALSSAREQAVAVTRRAQDGLVDAIERHPVLVGGIGLFIGAVIAAAIPTSRAESRFLGESSDELKNRARDLAAQGYETAKAAAGNVYEAGKQAIEEQGLNPGALREAVQDIGEKARTAYERAAKPGEAGEANGQVGGGMGQASQGAAGGWQPPRTAGS